MKQSDNSTTTYIHEIKQILVIARQKAYIAVNFATVEACFTGKRIVEEKQHGKGGSEQSIRRTVLAQFRQSGFVKYLKRLNRSHIQGIMRVSNPKPCLTRRDARLCVSTLTNETTTPPIS
jgi:hypothetical protein